MTPADMREAAAALAERHFGAGIATAIRALPIPEAPALPGLDLAAIEGRAAAAAPGPWTLNGDDDRASGEPALICTGPTVVAVIQFDGTDDDAAFIAAARADVPTLCAAHRSLITQRDAWVRAAFSIACDGPDQLAERLAALVAERDAQRSAAEGWERQAHEVEGRYAAACEERERMRGTMEEARGHLRQYVFHEPCVMSARAALTSAGQKQAEPVPTPEDVLRAWRQQHPCLGPTFEDGVRAERARRGGR